MRADWPLRSKLTGKYKDYPWFVLSAPHPANIRDYWREAGVERCRKSFASAREGQQYKLDWRQSVRKRLLISFCIMVQATLGKYPG